MATQIFFDSGERAWGETYHRKKQRYTSVPYELSAPKAAPPVMSIMCLMWITRIPLLVIKTNRKPSDIILRTRPLLHDSEKDTVRWEGALGQTFWCEYKASGLKGSHSSLSKSPPPFFFLKSIMLNVIIKQYYWHNVEGNFQQLQKALSCLPYLHLLGVWSHEKNGTFGVFQNSSRAGSHGSC